jgi:uncharacterized protein
MSRSHRSLLLLTGVGVCATIALLASSSVPEAFYALLPLVPLAIYLNGVEDWTLALQTRIRPGVTIIGGLFGLSLGLAFLFLDCGVVLSWRFWIEVASCLYYLAGALIVLLTVRRSLLAFAKSLHERWRFSPGVRLLLCEVVPMALFVLFALPYSLAFANVHRFKMPNLGDPQRAWQRDFDEIEFASADGTVLRGWWIPAKTPSSRTLIICHGIAANRSVFLPFVEAGDWLDANVLMFDLRGHGDSGGRSVTLGYKEKDDVLAAIDYVRRERPDASKQVIGMGISLGAACLAEATPHAEPPLDAVILDSCFASTADMTHSVLGVFPSGVHPWLLTLGLPMADWHAGCPMMAVRPEESIRGLRSPVLLLHSRGDPLIPVEHTLRVYANAPEPKRLCVFELPGHCDGFFAQKERYRAEVMAISARLGPCGR